MLMSAIYATYCVIMCLLFTPFSLLSSFYIPIGYVLMIIIPFASLWMVLRSISTVDSKIKNTWILVLTFFASPLCVGVLSLLIGNGSELGVIIFLSSFLVMPILPVILFVIWTVFEDLKSKVIVASDQNSHEEIGSTKKFPFPSDGGGFSEMELTRIIAFEANDNYVNIYFLNERDELMKIMQRMSMRRAEGMLSELNAGFFRVHKSYIVNPLYLKEIKGRAQAYKLEMYHLVDQISVSRSFNVDLLKKSLH